MLLTWPKIYMACVKESALLLPLQNMPANNLTNANQQLPFQTPRRSIRYIYIIIIMLLIVLIHVSSYSFWWWFAESSTLRNKLRLLCWLLFFPDKKMMRTWHLCRRLSTEKQQENWEEEEVVGEKDKKGSFFSFWKNIRENVSLEEQVEIVQRHFNVFIRFKSRIWWTLHKISC